MTKVAYSASNPRLTGFTNRTFGIELEIGFKNSSFAAVKDRLIARLAAVGIAAASESYNHVTKAHWKFVADASITSGGIELVSPILSGVAGLEAVEKVCSVLAEFNACVDKSMGFHVHHGVLRGENPLSLDDLKVLARLVARFKNVFDGLVAPSRRNNYFCRHHDESELATVERATSMESLAWDRYRALNFCSLARHTTVEFRQHQGTVEAKKIIAWVMLTQGLVEKARYGRGRKHAAGSVAANGDGLNNLLRAAGLRTCLPHAQKVNEEHEKRVREVADFLRARAKEFGLINLAERSEVRSRARRTAASVVAEAVASEASAV